MRGGMYGFGGTIGTAGPIWENGGNPEVSKVDGSVIPDPNATYTGGRRRKSRKATRRHRRRRGGMDPTPTPPTLTGPEPAAGIPIKVGTSSSETTTSGTTTSGTTPAGNTGGRRRKSKKAKKGKKTSRRHRRMRGGSSYLPSTTGVYGFTGAGVARGMGGFEDVSGGNQIRNGVTPLA